MICSVSLSRFDSWLDLMAAHVDNQGMMLDKCRGLAQHGGNDASMMAPQAIYSALALGLMVIISLSAKGTHRGVKKFLQEECSNASLSHASLLGSLIHGGMAPKKNTGLEAM